MDTKSTVIHLEKNGWKPDRHHQFWLQSRYRSMIYLLCNYC